MPTEEKSCRNCGFNSSSDNYIHMCHDPKPCVDTCDWLPKGSIDVEIIKNKARGVELELELKRVNDYLGKIDKVLSEEKPKTPNQIREDIGMKPVLKDSGNRTQFQTGAVRDMHQGKGRCDLLPPNALLRLARHFENGATKYGDRNWELGIPCHSFADSGMRHLLKFMAGDTDEDHLIAAIWNLMCLAETEILRPEMQDIPSRMKEDESSVTFTSATDFYSFVEQQGRDGKIGVSPTAMDLLHTIKDSKFCGDISRVKQKGEDYDGEK